MLSHVDMVATAVISSLVPVSFVPEYSNVNAMLSSRTLVPKVPKSQQVARPQYIPYNTAWLVSRWVLQAFRFS